MAGFDPNQPRDADGQWTKAEQAARNAAFSQSPGGGLQLTQSVAGRLFSRTNIVNNETSIGYIQYKVEGQGLKINEIQVSESFRGQGIATRAVKDLMSKTGTTYLKQTTLTADGKVLYAKLQREGIPVK